MHRLLSLLLFVVLAFPATAGAFPWVIRHGYTSCGECHQDPSGAGVLTDYGRAQAEILLAMPYKRSSDWEPGKEAGFLMGLVKLPSSVALQFDDRSLFIPEPGNFREVQMQTDLRGHVRMGKKLRGYLDLGYANEGAEEAWVTNNTSGGNLVSRQYWLGYDLNRNLFVRAGRMDLPFGLRTEEHFLYTNNSTGTDINADQETGLALAWNQDRYRGEIMGIAGNFQVSPDQFRERGVSGFLAMKVASRTEVGISALGTYTAMDVGTLQPRTRAMGGAFARAVPWTPLVLSAEADALVDVTAGTTGVATYLQADLEPTQGIHVKGTGEFCSTDLGSAVNAVSAGWLSGWWFITSRVDVRLDAAHGSLYCEANATPNWLGPAQVHLLL